MLKIENVTFVFQWNRNRDIHINNTAVAAMCAVYQSLCLFLFLLFVLFHFCFRIFLHLDIRIKPSCSPLYTHTHSISLCLDGGKQNTTIEFLVLRNTFKCMQTDSLLFWVSIILSLTISMKNSCFLLLFQTLFWWNTNFNFFSGLTK